MANNTLVTISTVEEGNIDRDRIVDGEQVPDEYFCPICQYLLWKPRSCSSCQHLFCEKCIRTWLENASNTNKCPFRCQPFEDCRCPPYVQSILSRLNIHCRNSIFGCTEILSYDQLEHHENVECKYLSQRCVECDKPVLLSKFVEHLQMPGLCVPQPIKCTACQNFIESSTFREHFYQCCQQKSDQLSQTTYLNPMLNNQPVPANNVLGFFLGIINKIQLVEQQKQMSRLPTVLKGVDKVRRAREQQCGHLYHILIMLQFILLNWTKLPYFIYTLTFGGCFVIILLLLASYTLFFHWAYTHMHIGPLLIILFSVSSSYGTYFAFEYLSDMTIIFCIGIVSFLWGCTNRVSLELYEMDDLFNRPILGIVFCCLLPVLTEIILLLLQLYYWLIPIYIAATIYTLFNFYFGFKVHCNYANVMRQNQPLLPV